jgi:hypothetical protein
VDSSRKQNAIRQDGAHDTNIFSCLVGQNYFNAFRNAFRLGFHPEFTTLKPAKANCPSALQHSSVIDKYLAKEVSLGWVFGF